MACLAIGPTPEACLAGMESLFKENSFNGFDRKQIQFQQCKDSKKLMPIEMVLSKIKALESWYADKGLAMSAKSSQVCPSQAEESVCAELTHISVLFWSVGVPLEGEGAPGCEKWDCRARGLAMGKQKSRGH